MHKPSQPIVDLECHFFPDFAYEAFAKNETTPHYDPETSVLTFYQEEGCPPVACPQNILFPRIQAMGQERIDIFEEHGVKRAMVSAAPGVELLEGQAAIDLARDLNDLVYENMVAFPEFYTGSMVLPIDNIDAALEEMERNAARGFKVWHTHSNYHNQNRRTSLDDPEYFPLLAKAEELGLLVYLHPTTSTYDRLMKYGYMFNAAALGFTIDTQITILALIVNGVFDKLPTLQVMLGHLGEALAFTFDRIDDKLMRPFVKKMYVNELPPSKYFGRNISISTSGNYSVEAFEMCRQLIGIDYICYGSDFPFESLDENTLFMNKLEEILTPEDYAKVSYKNALRILKLDEI